MITNSIGTILYSLLKGKKVGSDKQGNTFYVHRKNKKKRWVLYKKHIDPTSLEVKWQVWLTAMNIDEEITNNHNNYKWQKSKKANPTGTSESYHPGSETRIKSKFIHKQKKNEIWKPD